MANTAVTSTIVRGRHQFQALFSSMFLVNATISDQDAIAATNIVRFGITVPGVASGDIVLYCGVNDSMIDAANDNAHLYAIVDGADSVRICVHADDGEFAADSITGKTVKMVIGRPAW